MPVSIAVPRGRWCDRAHPQHDYQQTQPSQQPLRLHLLLFDDLYCRNITISGPADQWPIIDLQAKAGLLELCATCTFTFQHLMIANETAKGRTSGISILRGRTGGRVDATNTYGLHVACPPTASSLQIISTTQCSPLFPGLDRPQVASATNATFRGKTYTDCLDVEDMTADIPLTLVTGGVYMGGYAIRRRNSIRLCQMTITAACLAVNTPEQCLAQLMDAGGGGGGPSQGSNLTVVAAPVAVVGAVSLAAVVALLVFKHRRRRKQRQYAEQQLLPYTLHKQAAAASGNDAGGLHDQDGSSTRDPPTPAQSISQPSRCVRHGPGVVIYCQRRLHSPHCVSCTDCICTCYRSARLLVEVSAEFLFFTRMLPQVSTTAHS
eukprot:GHUV01018141.1.p2 GENE.GHUV01018141.1~~GHUV01018141.1.p2  ORF type:complete len:378 (+),score=71.24 GHUV01018141.1:230-1363(+)